MTTVEEFLAHRGVTSQNWAAPLDPVDEYLAHYGVLGMKWGQRKKEPVSAEKQAKREVRAQKFVKRAGQYDSAINKLKSQRSSNGFVARQKAGQIKDLTKLRDKALKNAERKRNGKLSTTQRNLVIGAAVVGTLVAASVVQDKIESGEFTQMAAKGKAFLNKTDATDFKKKVELAKPDLSIDEIQNAVVKDINPDFGKIGTKMNCRRATFAYEMRRRGYDVRATKTTEGNGQTAVGLYNALNKANRTRNASNSATVMQLTKEGQLGQIDKSRPITQFLKGNSVGAKNAIDKVSNMSLAEIMGDELDTATKSNYGEAIFKTLAKQPNRSRGEVAVTWRQGGGHSMAYEVINGIPSIIDSQSGKIFQNADELSKALPDIGSSGFTRLDNVHLNKDYLLRWLKNVE